MNYSLDNVKKFLEDNGAWVGDLAEGILARANACAVRGIISDSLTQEIMENDFLVGEFHRVVFFDVSHTNIIGATMIKNNEEDRKNISSENFKKALELIQEANLLLKKEWDGDKYNHLASGCYKALNAVTHVLYEKVNACEQDEDYVFSRLMEAISRLANFYGVSIGEALLYSGFFSLDQLEAMSSKK